MAQRTYKIINPFRPFSISTRNEEDKDKKPNLNLYEILKTDLKNNKDIRETEEKGVTEVLNPSNQGRKRKFPEQSSSKSSVSCDIVHVRDGSICTQCKNRLVQLCLHDDMLTDITSILSNKTIVTTDGSSDLPNSTMLDRDILNNSPNHDADLREGSEEPEWFDAVSFNSTPSTVLNEINMKKLIISDCRHYPEHTQTFLDKAYSVGQDDNDIKEVCSREVENVQTSDNINNFATLHNSSQCAATLLKAYSVGQDGNDIKEMCSREVENVQRSDNITNSATLPNSSQFGCRDISSLQCAASYEKVQMFLFKNNFPVDANVSTKSHCVVKDTGDVDNKDSVGEKCSSHKNKFKNFSEAGIIIASHSPDNDMVPPFLPLSEVFCTASDSCNCKFSYPTHHETNSKVTPKEVIKMLSDLETSLRYFVENCIFHKPLVPVQRNLVKAWLNTLKKVGSTVDSSFF